GKSRRLACDAAPGPRNANASREQTIGGRRWSGARPERAGRTLGRSGEERGLARGLEALGGELPVHHLEEAVHVAAAVVLVAQVVGVLPDVDDEERHA